MEQHALLVVHGMNWARRRHRYSGATVLSMQGRLNVLAAARLFAQGKYDAILFTGGHTAGPGHPSEAGSMRRRLLHRFPSIPETSVFAEESSHTTGENVAGVQSLLHELAASGLAFSHIAVLKAAHELPRAQRIYATHGLRVDSFLSPEEVLATHPSPLLRRHVRRHLLSPYRQWRISVERLYRFLLSFNPRGTWSIGRYKL